VLGPAGLNGASKGFYDAGSGRYLHWTWIWTDNTPMEEQYGEDASTPNR